MPVLRTRVPRERVRLSWLGQQGTRDLGTPRHLAQHHGKVQQALIRADVRDQGLPMIEIRQQMLDGTLPPGSGLAVRSEPISGMFSNAPSVTRRCRSSLSSRTSPITVVAAKVNLMSET